MCTIDGSEAINVAILKLYTLLLTEGNKLQLLLNSLHLLLQLRSKVL